MLAIAIGFFFSLLRTHALKANIENPHYDHGI